MSVTTPTMAPATQVGWQSGAFYNRHIGLRYPSPFFDQANQYLPQTWRELFMWCSFYVTTNPLINAAVYKMAEYPVTGIIYESGSAEMQDRYREIEEALDLRTAQVEIGLDYHAYGNAFVSVYYPFTRYLVCKACGDEVPANVHNRSHYRWRGHQFHLTCRKCRTTGVATIRDEWLRRLRDIKILRWNPVNISAKHVPETGGRRYYYHIPRATLNDIAMGDYQTIETMPQPFLDAARQGTPVIMGDNFYHLSRPGIAQQDLGVGTPLVYPVLKHAFYQQTLRKAQETLASEYIVPFRSIYPGPPGGGADNPFASYNLVNWQAAIRQELNNWKRDPNYIGIFPVNVQFQQWGGTGKALILHHELRQLSEEIITGMHLPIEFIQGGLQWQGTNTSVQALANQFTGFNQRREKCILRFILGGVCSFLGMETPRARFRSFRMPDDLQRSMFYFQLNQAQKISNRTMLEESNLDPVREMSRMREELPNEQQTMRLSQTAAARIQGEVGLLSAQYQAKAMAIQSEAQMAIAAKQQEQAATAQAMQMGMQPLPLPPPPMPPPALGFGGADEGQGEKADPTRTAKLPAPLQGLGYSASAGDPAANMTLETAKAEASRIRRLPPTEQGVELQRLKFTNPSVYQVVLQLLDNRSGAQNNPTDALRNPAPNGTGAGTDLGRQLG